MTCWPSRSRTPRRARPTPAYSDISLAIQKSFHPPENIEPDDIESKLKERLDKAAEGKIF